MKLFKFMKDGGPLSKSSGLFFVELKRLFSVVLLHFTDGSRDAYHTHAFNAVSWVLWGKLVERDIYGRVTHYTPSLRPVITLREKFHKVVSVGDTWVLSFRGPWVKQWTEFLPTEQKFITLTNGRKIVNTWPAFSST